MDRQRVHARLRRLPAHRCRARRPLRAPAHVLDRHRHLHGCLRGCRARPVDRRARCRARSAGARRRDRAAPDADHPLGRRPGGATRRLPRRVGRHQRSRGRLRAARRRCRRERHLLALDLLAQRSARPRAAAARLAAARRDEGAARARRPARRRARQCGALRDRLGARARQLGGLGHARDPRSVRSRLRVRRGFRRVGAARRAPDAADALLPQPHVRTGECGVDADELRDVRLGVPARAVLPDRAGLLAARLRPAHPPVDCDADDRGPDRGRALGPHLSVADHRHGARPAGRRPGVDRRGVDAHYAVRRPDRAVRAVRDRHGPLLRADREPGPLDGAQRGRGPGLRCEQRRPRAGRRLRRRSARSSVRALRRLHAAAPRSWTG